MDNRSVSLHSTFIFCESLFLCLYSGESNVYLIGCDEDSIKWGSVEATKQSSWDTTCAESTLLLLPLCIHLVFPSLLRRHAWVHPQSWEGPGTQPHSLATTQPGNGWNQSPRHWAEFVRVKIGRTGSTFKSCQGSQEPPILFRKELSFVSLIILSLVPMLFPNPGKQMTGCVGDRPVSLMEGRECGLYNEWEIGG